MAFKRRHFAQRRKAVGYSQEQLAERLGVERSTVVRWERGETEPQPWLRPRIARTHRANRTVAEFLESLAEALDQRMWLSQWLKGKRREFPDPHWEGS